MRVLYVGNYRDATGWSHGALAYIQALDLAGVEVACRPVKLNDVPGEIPPSVAAMERRKFDGYEAVIQNLLPHQMDFHGGYRRNIALYYAETSHFRQTRWAEHINCMDEAWVCCLHNQYASRASGVTVPIRVFPIPCDTRRYERHYESLSIRRELADHFIFYTIGEMAIRKNFKDMLMAFHLEFDVNEPVSLLIKTTPKTPGQHGAWRTERGMEEYCTGVKQGMKLYGDVEKYKKEIIVAGRYSDEEMMRLHASCDCGVFVSHGESWSLPCFDSMAMGKTPIATDYGGFREYINPRTGWPVPATLEPAYATQMDTFPDLHTSREDWATVDIASLRGAMREAYEDRERRREKSLEGMDKAYDFSLERVGKMMKEAIA